MCDLKYNVIVFLSLLYNAFYENNNNKSFSLTVD